MGKPHYILLPVSRLFIALSLVGAFMLNLLPTGGYWGVPDWVALVLVFWNVHQPRKVGIGIAFMLGLAMDVHDAALLGEHALAYTLLSYGAITLHRRVLWVSVPGQMVYVLPLLMFAQFVTLAIRLFAGAAFPGPMALLQSPVATLLWPLVTVLLLAPQRRSIDRDENRPL
ncbi:MAG TPA: rod shape-determining protein MreD [Burkholderiaceae bacterium]|nr:rod shape-determining protein MreD [Burkholderiaceae bacterium]